MADINTLTKKLLEDAEADIALVEDDDSSITSLKKQRDVVNSTIDSLKADAAVDRLSNPVAYLSDKKKLSQAQDKKNMVKTALTDIQAKSEDKTVAESIDKEDIAAIGKDLQEADVNYNANLGQMNNRISAAQDALNKIRKQHDDQEQRQMDQIDQLRNREKAEQMNQKILNAQDTSKTPSADQEQENSDAENANASYIYYDPKSGESIDEFVLFGKLRTKWNEHKLDKYSNKVNDIKLQIKEIQDTLKYLDSEKDKNKYNKLQNQLSELNQELAKYSYKTYSANNKLNDLDQKMDKDLAEAALPSDEAMMKLFEKTDSLLAEGKDILKSAKDNQEKVKEAEDPLLDSLFTGQLGGVIKCLVVGPDSCSESDIEKAKAASPEAKFYVKKIKAVLASKSKDPAALIYFKQKLEAELKK